MARVNMDENAIKKAVAAGSRPALAAKLNAAAVYAAANAPRESGAYASSFAVRLGAYAGWVVNSDPAAAYIEFGTRDTPRFRVLGRAVDALRAGG